MPLDFPSSPVVGQYYNGYIWDGTVWDSALQPSVPALLTTAPVYADVAARTTAVPSPAEGQLSYLNDINQFQGYAGSSWRPLGGLVPMVPPTVSVSGGTAAANSLGVITFSGASSISLNNVFTSAYANYRVLISGGLFTSSNNSEIWMRFRAAGTDASSFYFDQGIIQLGVNAPAASYASNSNRIGIGNLSTNNYASFSMDVFSPALSAFETMTTFSGYGFSGSTFHITKSSLHDVAASYDGLTLGVSAGTFTGTVQVLGYNS